MTDADFETPGGRLFRRYWVCWMAMNIATRVVQWVLRTWSPSLVVILVIGAIVAMNLQAIWTPFRQSSFVDYLEEASGFYKVFPWRYSNPDYLRDCIRPEYSS